MWLSHRIEFPNLGIVVEHLPDSFVLFGNVELTIYGIMIGIAILAGFLMAQWQAARTGQDKELYLDFSLYAVLSSLLGARLCYAVFAWEEFREEPLQILNIQRGGMAIYGAILAAVLTAAIYSRIRKVSFWLLADTGCIGLVAGQVIGRWGNFFNREVFGTYTDNLFAMRLELQDVAASAVTKEMIIYAERGGYSGFIQVHPVFLYESLWNFVLLMFLLICTRRKKFDGELFLLYLVGYAAGRVWMEGLRTDPLYLWGTGIPISWLMSVILIVIGLLLLIILYRKNVRKANVQRGGKGRIRSSAKK